MPEHSQEINTEHVNGKAVTFCPWESPESDSEPDNDDSTTADGDANQNDDDTRRDDGDAQQNTDDATSEQNDDDANQEEGDRTNTSDGDLAPPKVGLIPSAPTLEYSSTSLEKSTIELNVVACTSAGGTG